MNGLTNKMNLKSSQLCTLLRLVRMVQRQYPVLAAEPPLLPGLHPLLPDLGPGQPLPPRPGEAAVRGRGGVGWSHGLHGVSGEHQHRQAGWNTPAQTALSSELCLHGMLELE